MRHFRSSTLRSISRSVALADPSNGIIRGASVDEIKTPDAKMPVIVISEAGNVVWKIRTKKATSYNVEADLVATPKDAGQLTLTATDQKLSATFSATESADNVKKKLTLGTMTLPAGTTELVFAIGNAVHEGRIRLRYITLNPATQPSND